MHTRILPIILALGLSIALSPRATAQGSAPGSIKAASVTGKVFVTVKATGLKTAVTGDTAIAQGDVVTTEKDSSVVLVFSNGATVNLADDSELDITQFTQDPFSTAFSPAHAKAEPTTSTTMLNLVHGELVSRVLKLNVNRGSQFVVQTPVGAAGIRGTVFRIIFRINPTTGAVTYSLVTQSGTVRVHINGSGTYSGSTADVSAGQEVTISAKASIDANGNISVTTPNGTVVIPTTASGDTTQEIEASANVIAQAVANVLVPPPSNSSTGSPSAPVILINPTNPTTVSPSH